MRHEGRALVASRPDGSYLAHPLLEGVDARVIRERLESAMSAEVRDELEWTIEEGE